MSPRGIAANVAAGLVGVGLALLAVYLWRGAPQQPDQPADQPPGATAAAGLDAVAPGDAEAFRAWLAGRGPVADSDPDRRRVGEAQAAWAERTVAAAIASADDMRPFMPLEARETLQETAASLRALAAELTPDASPFLAARRRLFEVALEHAQEEAHRHLMAGDGARAFGLARTHAVNWSPEGKALGEEFAGRLTRFRNGYEFLSGWVGTPVEGPSLAPTPRVREVAPPPRTVP
jgi:hypothetical protein